MPLPPDRAPRAATPTARSYPATCSRPSPCLPCTGLERGVRATGRSVLGHFEVTDRFARNDRQPHVPQFREPAPNAFSQVGRRRVRFIQRRAQDLAHLFLHRTATRGGADPKSAFEPFIEISYGKAGHGPSLDAESCIVIIASIACNWPDAPDAPPKAGRVEGSSIRSHLQGGELPMRMLHTMLRVGNLQRSLDFYVQVLGMRLLRTTDRPEQKYTLAFVGYADESEQAVLELTYNYGVERYELGSAFGHVAIGVPDVAAACDRIRKAGGTIAREPGPVKGGTTVIAFVQDPDGYKIELIEQS